MSRKNLLVTGCSSGIGRTAALGLKARGYRVFATARKPEDIEQLQQSGLDALFLDYADSASVQRAFEQVMAACAEAHSDTGTWITGALSFLLPSIALPSKLLKKAKSE